MRKVVIVIPTYNEAGNIKPLFKKLREIFQEIGAKWDMHVLVVDDSSPDGTGELVKEEMKRDKSIHLFVNEKKVGLGGAYMKGMTYAIEELSADVLMEMDADFQHDMTLIPKFLEKIDEGADLVLGSRYMRGGSIPKYWGFFRKVLSVGGNIFIRTMMLERNIHDWTTGFRALKPELFTKVKGSIKELKTYSFQISFVYFARKAGAKIAEVPLNFGERKWGESKIPAVGGTIKTFWFVIKTRAMDFLKSRFFKFGIVGFVGYLVNAFFLYLFSRQGFPEWASWAVSTELAIISNFTLNNIWTFRQERITGVVSLVKKFFQFNVSSLGALLIQTVAGTLGVALLGPGYRQILLPFIIAFLVLPYNYFMYNVFIWKTWKIPVLEKIQKLV